MRETKRRLSPRQQILSETGKGIKWMRNERREKKEEGRRKIGKQEIA